MAQLFPPFANTLARLSLVGGAGFVGLLFAAGSGITRSPYGTNVRVALDQPIPFSHEHHATELGIDCRYCHTSVETSATAGVPPTQTCMSCHSQIWTNSPLLEPIRQSYQTGRPIHWNKVNAVPDFVYFNHSIHINRGVNCNICHGPVQQMMLTYKGQALFMSWCVDCHRHPEKVVQRGGAKAVFALYQDYQRRDISELTPRERALADGEDYNPTPAELEEGKKILDEYKMTATKKQLTDCWTCHR